MNWLGQLVQREVAHNYTLLDLGCGIMQATTDSMTNPKRKLINQITGNHIIKCKSLLGCELIDKYINVAKTFFPVIKFDLNDSKAFDIFQDNSFDVVMALDMIEHIEYPQALKIIGHMERIARKKIIIYTPSKFESNEKNVEDAWGLGENPFQKHLNFIPPSRFIDWGYKITHPKPDKNTLAIKVLK